ncbi:DegT/DnrJ/EryC1/StrS family aminotransferase [Desulfogranum japonicum]|uniref:DegT/DnrJ/EryC1/StrS family aminotransferase n=1 Tax=Desulfogranum japonicum TaxID=231447 RepID=UPI00040F1C19|nr:DegT/DnrJ/EryC1/StrS family aminotransferase [Desulfogranum japonicum]
MEKFLPFALPDIGEDEINEVLDSLRSGWLTTGPKTKNFEKQFETFIGKNVEAFAVNSATSGLHLALEAIGITQGDEVITTPYTFTSTAEVIRYLGADPVFVDVSPDTLNIAPEKIESSITSRTKAIIPVHFAGLACDMDPILSIAQKYNLKVVEDAAHALPSTYKGSLIGSLQSDATVYSFYATKTVATGEGGMIVTHNAEIAKRCKIMRLHGISRDAFDRYTSTKPSWHYEVVAPGFKYNMTDIAASLGIHQLRKIWQFHEKRKALAVEYDKAFADLPLLLPSKAPGEDFHAWHLYVIRLQDQRMSRNQFIELMAEKGIGCSVHFIPLHLHPYWRDRYNFEPEDFPNALHAYNNAISLPLYTKMDSHDQERVIQAVQDILK